MRDVQRCNTCGGTEGHHFVYCSASPSEHESVNGADIRAHFPSELTVFIAKLCHEVNRIHCAANGDYSHQSWERTPENIKQSVISGVQGVLSDPHRTPHESHEAWLEYKRNEGWTYGETKDLVAKTHPCMVPYEELPKHDRIKDELFTAICRTFVGTVG